MTRDISFGPDDPRFFRRLKNGRVSITHLIMIINVDVSNVDDPVDNLWEMEACSSGSIH